MAALKVCPPAVMAALWGRRPAVMVRLMVDRPVVPAKLSVGLRDGLWGGFEENHQQHHRHLDGLLVGPDLGSH